MVAAQAPAERPPLCEYDRTCTVWWAQEVAVIGANVLIGGLTAGIWQELRGGSFGDGFARGSLGGVIGYAGKRLATGRFPGAGLLGRQLGAVGHSVVRNAAEGRGTFSRVTLPLLFLPAHIQLGERGRHSPVRVDLLPAWYFAYGLFQPKASLDLERSLSWGSPVFVSDEGYQLAWDGHPSAALATVGAIFIDRRSMSPESLGRLGAHERVHIVQIDFVLSAWSDPLDEWLAPRLPGGGVISRYLAPNILAAALLVPQGWLVSHLDYYHVPWELEAMALAGDLR